MTNQTYENTIRLRVTRNYTPEPVEDGHLEQILQAARWTGSSKNTQGWRFVVVEGDDREQVASAGRYTQPIRDAAVTICLVRTPEGNDFDIGRAAQNIMIAADSLGLGSCPVTLHHGDRVRAVLSLPDGHHCRYAVAIGHPDEAAEAEARRARRRRGAGGRKPLDELVHRGKLSD